MLKGCEDCVSFEPAVCCVHMAFPQTAVSSQCCEQSRGVGFPARIEEQNGLSQTGLPCDLSARSLQSNGVTALC